MKFSKKKLLSIAKKVKQGKKITPLEISELVSFDKKDEEPKLLSLLKKGAVPVAITAGFLIAVFPGNAESIATRLPSWTNLPDPVQNGLNYIWNIIGEPVERTNILFHLPNIILYSFGFLGVKKLFDAIDRKTWIDKVTGSKELIETQINNGTLDLDLAKGHSILFSGNGDFIASQFAQNHSDNMTVSLCSKKPDYTNIWNFYDTQLSYEDLEKILNRANAHDAGEYIFFPVKDDQIFLPNKSAYDLSPHRIDILCQDIRTIEKKNRWTAKQILIVGDKTHTSFVQSEDKKGKIQKSEDKISLDTISKKYPKITIIDPTDIVLSKVIEIAQGRKIAFRATREGLLEYKKRFYQRLQTLAYRELKSKKGILTIGYDILEDQTEQQTLSRKIDSYYPVVLSKAVKDALHRNGYKKNEFIYVPELILSYLKKEALKQ